MKIWPMGCKKIEKDSDLEKILTDPNYIGQEKIKGVRAVMHVLQDGSLRFTTRGSSISDPDTPIDITHRLPHITKYKIPALAGTILDSEMWAEGMDDAEIAGKLGFRSTVPVPEEIQPRFFDVVQFGDKPVYDKQLLERLKYLQYLSKSFGSNEKLSWAHFVPWSYNSEAKRRMLYKLLESGKEGMVFKNLTSLYRIDEKKSKKVGTWYKYKRKDSVDARITGSTPPEQFYRDQETGIYDFGRSTKPWALGWFGSLNFEFYDPEGQAFTGSCAGMTDGMRALLSDGDHGVKTEYIGRVIEVEFFERNKYGNCEHPRFIRLREEVEIEG